MIKDDFNEKLRVLRKNGDPGCCGVSQDREVEAEKPTEHLGGDTQ